MRLLVISTVLVLVLWAACFDFGVDTRRYRCDTDPTICGAGRVCGADGFCEPAPMMSDAALSDAPASEQCHNGLDDDSDELVDCRDPDCGAASCMDDNPCTTDVCSGTGMCENGPVSDETNCGMGCSCRAGVPTELACGDSSDNDGDGAFDCEDDDCPMCGPGLMCCAGGSCRPNC